MGKLSSFEGAEVGGDRQGPLDAGRFWAELSSTLGIAAASRQGVKDGFDGDSTVPGPSDESQSSSESDGFYSDQEDVNGRDGKVSEVDRRKANASPAMPEHDADGADRQATRRVRRANTGGGQLPSSWAGPRIVLEGAEPTEDAQQEAWEASTATDSDDEVTEASDAEFMTEYDRALQHELRGTRLAESFERVPGASAEQPTKDGGEDRQARSTAEERDSDGEGEEGEGDGMRPVDVDLNLISSLLESFASQQGMPGPASNLAGMLGLKLPHDTNEV